MSKSLKNSDVIYWKLYSRKLIPQTFQTAKFTKPQTNSTKRIHQKGFKLPFQVWNISKTNSLCPKLPFQVWNIPKTNSSLVWISKSKVSENQQNQDLKIFPDSVFQMLPQCINQKTRILQMNTFQDSTLQTYAICSRSPDIWLIASSEIF